MQRSTLFISVILVKLLCFTEAKAQTVSEFETTIKHFLAKIESIHNSPESENKYDSLLAENSLLKDYLIETLPKIPNSTSLTFGDMFFPSYSFGVWIRTSPDKKIRQWAWDTRMGGTMPNIGMVLEFETPNGIKAVNANDSESINDFWIDSFYILKKPNGQIIYLLVENWKADSRTSGQRVIALSIIDTSISLNLPIFENDEHTLIDDISFGFDVFDFLPDKKTPELSIMSNGEVIHVPKETKKGRWEGFTTFKYNGEYFKKIMK
ncbi:MAG TPA: hypothetical protein VFO76_10760 [Candidatus Kapabacteria bacterium]|nr:hypothetical protein [Candidatus Kapabacteria bacterium]